MVDIMAEQIEQENKRLLRVAMAQINTTVGDFGGNRRKILDAVGQARSLGVDLVTFPELAVCGYPPEDLLFKPKFIEENRRSLDKIIEASAEISLVTGFVDNKDGIYNAAAVISNGKLAGIYRKIYLPNYGVFDENRYFNAGNRCPVYIIGGVCIGVNICEDIWYDAGPAGVQALSGAEVIVNISASPYHSDKGNFRQKMLAKRAASHSAIFVYNNLVGGQDELVFDGHSMVIDEKGCLIASGRQFEEDLVVADLDISSVLKARSADSGWRKNVPLPEEQQWFSPRVIISKDLPSAPKPPVKPEAAKPLGFPGEVYRALVLGTRDYITKNGFEKVVIGLSGGIDSSLVTAIAVDALGKDNVIGVVMSSMYSSPGSVSDSGLLAENLGIRLLFIPIHKIYKAYIDTLAESFKNIKQDLTEENIQARIRGNILMALSNKFGWIVLTTGNKSEMATGYTTLYGDMAGGFAVIKDVPKTLVYQLAIYRNESCGSELIPTSVISKPPSAELRPEQKDADSLPPYELLDPFLTAYVEEDKSIEQIIAAGTDRDIAIQAARLVDTSEYKRRQSPPGIKITPRAFGRDRRLPITNRFRGV